jgi:hypothetical protein
VAYQTGLLRYDATIREDDKIGNATNIEAPSNLGIFFRVDFQHDSLAGHVSGGSLHFRSSGAARPAPICPEVYEYGHRGILNDFIE